MEWFSELHCFCYQTLAYSTYFRSNHFLVEKTQKKEGMRLLVAFMSIFFIRLEMYAQQISSNDSCRNYMNPAHHYMYRDCQAIKSSDKYDIRIYLDTAYRNRTYYSDEAKKYLEFAEKTDPANMKIPNWEKLNAVQKKEYIHLLKSNFIHKADSINDLRNIYHFAIENHTTDSIEIILSDFSVLNFTEAKNRSGEWIPIEYWGYSDCGLSIKKIRQPPSSKRYIAKYNTNEGDLKQKQD